MLDNRSNAIVPTDAVSQALMAAMELMKFWCMSSHRMLDNTSNAIFHTEAVPQALMAAR